MLAPEKHTGGDYMMSRDLFVQMARIGAHAILAVRNQAPSEQLHAIDPAQMTPADVAALLGQAYASCVMVVAMDPDAPEDVGIFVPFFRRNVEEALSRSHTQWLAGGAKDSDSLPPNEEAERLADLIPDLLAQDDGQ